MTTALVIGAGGVLGRQVCAELADRGYDVVHGVRAPCRAADDGVGRRAVDVGEPALVRAATVLMCGLFPGLSAICATAATATLDEVEMIDVALLQSTNARVGARGTADMLQQISRPVPTSRGTFPGFSRRRLFRFGHDGAVGQVRLIDHDERDVVGRRCPGADVTYWTGWSARWMTDAVAAFRWARVLPLVARSGLTPRHDPGKAEAVRLTAVARGSRAGARATQEVRIEADSDYGMTAAVVGAVGTVLADRPALRGPSLPVDLVTLDELQAVLGDRMRVTRNAW